MIKKNFLLIFVLLFFIELFCFILIKFKIGSNYLQYFYGVKEYSKNEIELYLNKKDNLLGWPIQDINNKLFKNYNANGSRFSPANDNIDNYFSLSVYGDSFTFGSEVKHNEAWPNILAKNINYKVYNYGVPGYGVDQAVLKFINNKSDTSKLVILGIYPDDIERNLTQNYSIISDNELDLFSFKPKFKIDDKKKLKLIEIPIKEFEDFKHLKKDYKKYLKDDDLIHKYNKKLIDVKFPYSKVLYNSVVDFLKKKKNYISKTGMLPDNLPFWLRNTGSLDLNSKIVDLFFKNCNDRNITCKIFIIPDYSSLTYYINKKININKKIYEKYIWKKNVWDPTEWLFLKMKNRNVCYYLGINRNCNGHYNIEGNAILSKFLIEKIYNENLIKRLSDF